MPEYPDKMPVFSLENIRFGYKEKQAKPVLENVSLSLYPNQTIGLRGANGSGKTTLLRCITGLSKIDSGTIRLGEKIIKSEKDFYELRKKVGYVLQEAEDQLFFPSVLEDLTFGPLNMGESAQMARESAMSALDMVGMAGFAHRISWHLSGGEKKLVALAAILAMRPKALLLDEPLNELDEQSSKRVAEIIKKLDCAKIIISHDRQFLEDICPVILLLKNGVLAREK